MIFRRADILPIKNFIKLSETGNVKFLKNYDIEEPVGS